MKAIRQTLYNFVNRTDSISQMTYKAGYKNIYGSDLKTFSFGIKINQKSQSIKIYFLCILKHKQTPVWTVSQTITE